MAKKKQMELVKGSGRQTYGNQTPFSVPCSLCSLHFPVGVAVSLDDEIFQAKQRALQPKDAAGPGFGSWIPQIQNHFIPLW